MRARTLYLSAVFLLLQVASAQMLPTPPAGWTAQAAKSGILVTSPGPDPRLELVLFPPSQPQGDTKQWFDQQTITIARAIGSPQEMSDVLEVNAILARRLTYNSQAARPWGVKSPSGHHKISRERPVCPRISKSNTNGMRLIADFGMKRRHEVMTFRPYNRPQHDFHVLSITGWLGVSGIRRRGIFCASGFSSRAI